MKITEFVTYNQALKLKVLGFDEPCFGWYKLPNKRLCGEYEMVTFQNNYPHIKFIGTPTFSQAFRWFIEKYGYLSYIDMDNYSFYRYTIYKGKGISEAPFETYEEAELACLDKLIEIVESK